MILVTGGLGFIGSHATRALLDKGETVVVTQHRNGTVPSFLQDALGKQLFIGQADINEPESFRKLGEKYKIDRIVHLAAPKIGAMDIVDDLQTNVQGLLSIIRLARDWQTKRLVVASSMGVYGGASNPLREDAPLVMTGANPIGASKKTFEIIGDAIATHADMDIVFVRPSAIWGPLGRPASIFFSLPQMVHTAAKGAALDPSASPIFADDGIDMCYVKDCGKAIAILTVADHVGHRTYNIGSGKATTNAELAQLIKKTVPAAIFTLSEGRGPHSPAENMYMDVGRLHDLGFEPDYSIESAIADYVQWLRAGNEQ